MVAASKGEREHWPAQQKQRYAATTYGEMSGCSVFPGDVLRHCEKIGQESDSSELRLTAGQLSTDCESKIACCHFLTNQLGHQISRCARPWDNSALATFEGPGRWSHSNTMTLRLTVDDEGRKVVVGEYGTT